MNSKITRRKFIALSIKSITAFMALGNLNWDWDKIFLRPSVKNKFTIPIKPFSRNRVYKKHELAG